LRPRECFPVIGAFERSCVSTHENSPVSRNPKD
jgi:hypothetical protein